MLVITQLESKRVGKKINKNLRQQEVFLYAAHPFPLRIIKDGQIFYNSGTCKKRFVHETRCRPPIISDNTVRLCHAHSSTDGLEVTAIYTGKYLELNALRLGLKNISISNKLDNGQEEKIIFVPLFGMACNLLPLRRSFSVLSTACLWIKFLLFSISQDSQ